MECPSSPSAVSEVLPDEPIELVWNRRGYNLDFIDELFEAIAKFQMLNILGIPEVASVSVTRTSAENVFLVEESLGTRVPYEYYTSDISCRVILAGAKGTPVPSVGHIRAPKLHFETIRSKWIRLRYNLSVFDFVIDKIASLREKIFFGVPEVAAISATRTSSRTYLVDECFARPHRAKLELYPTWWESNLPPDYREAISSLVTGPAHKRISFLNRIKKIRQTLNKKLLIRPPNTGRLVLTSVNKFSQSVSLGFYSLDYDFSQSELRFSRSGLS
jgi:hypothetical protein